MSDKKKSDGVPIVKIPSSTRIDRINSIFLEAFDCPPSFFVRVPGRVNIIGEHIDYCGYPVLPMALEQDILIAVGVISEPELHLRNVNNKHCAFDTTIQSVDDIIIQPDANGKPFWYNYVLCGIKGGLEFIDNKITKGLRMYVDGNIPPASGLSSSSALVSAACLAFLYAQGACLSKTEIASLCARSERYIGTQGGGMDQAIAFLAERYCAQYITWDPLHATPISLPENATFVVAHSLAEANKAATNDFNRRVIECRLAAKILATVKGLSFDKKIITLSQVQNYLECNLADMINLVNEYLPKEIYRKGEIARLLSVTEEDMDTFYLTPNTRHLDEFKLRQRALHVYEEANRVEEFRRLCSALPVNDKKRISNGGKKCIEEGNGCNIVDVLGSLMSKSHDSLRMLYECSHDNLDRLVEISKDMCVYSRLTGAGWGGCIVALCHKDKVDEYIGKLIDTYYKEHCKISESEARDYVFATIPNDGAEIYIN